jgi:hypothetical protein
MILFRIIEENEEEHKGLVLEKNQPGGKRHVTRP